MKNGMASSVYELELPIMRCTIAVAENCPVAIAVTSAEMESENAMGTPQTIRPRNRTISSITFWIIISCPPYSSAAGAGAVMRL